MAGKDPVEREMPGLDQFVNIVEALIFASESPLKEDKLVEVFRTWVSENGGQEASPQETIANAVEELNHRYAELGSSFRVRKVGGGYKMYTLPELHRWVSDFLSERPPARLSAAALETLSIIAYRQPVVKSEIDNIRGVDSEGPLHSLLERGLIKTSGRKESPGRPYIFRTTPDFLTYFGLNDLSELPSEEELMSSMRAWGGSRETVEGHQKFFKEATAASPEEVGKTGGGDSVEEEREIPTTETSEREDGHNRDQGTAVQ